jgi:hypothetical protein
MSANNYAAFPSSCDTPAQDVPYFDDVTADEGWQGQTTSKSIESLKSEVTASIGRLGAMVISFQRGTFVIGEHERNGFQIKYVVESPSGANIMGRIDIAALPVRKQATYRRNSAYQSRCDQSLRMALYMLRVALDGTWLLQKLSPGYAALIPFMAVPQKSLAVSAGPQPVAATANACNKCSLLERFQARFYTVAV